MRALMVLSLGLAATAPRAESLDIQDYSVVYKVPGMERIAPRKDLPSGGGKLDLYLPVGAKSPPPVVVFVNGVGGNLKDWEIYKSWMRLVAARGSAAVAALDDAIAHGFTDRRLLETDEDLASVRSSPRFRALLDKLPPQ